MASPGAESDGESERTEALFRAHGPAVTALCRSLLRDRSEAEDAVQQVFLSAHRALLNGAAPREPLAWLLAVARHECYARFRQRAAAPLPAGAAPEGATPDASVHALRAGELARLWDEVGRMPAAQREAFLLREIRGLSYGQLADELSLSRPSVRSLLLRARTRLRHRLGDVATALGGAPWVQALLRLGLGGDATSTVPVATKAVVVGLGAAAIAGGGGAVPRVAHHASRVAGGHSAAPHRPAAPGHRAAAPHATLAGTRREDRSRSVERPAGRHDGSRDPGSGGSGSRDGGGDDAQVAAPVVVQPTTTTDGSDGGGGDSSSGPGPGTVTVSVTTTTTVADSSGPGPGSTDGGGRDGGGHDGGSSGSSDDGSGGDGG